MRYFNTQKITLDHMVDERDNDMNLHNDYEIRLEGDRRHSTLQDLQQRCQEEDMPERVAKGSDGGCQRVVVCGMLVATPAATFNSSGGSHLICV